MQGTRALGETASSRTRVGNIQDEHIVMPENKGSAFKKKQKQKTHSDGSMSKGHRIQLKRAHIS